MSEPSSDRATARLGIVLVNWNRADDSIECLESVLRCRFPARVVVVDNASADGSADRIAAWARGEVEPVHADPAMALFSRPAVRKPLALARLGRAAAETSAPTSAVTLIDAGGNLGFAGGNNVGLRHLLRDPAIDYVWLLNNDTVIDPDAPRALVRRMDATHGVGLCGTVVRFYWRPGVVQALNGSRFNWWTGNARGIGAGTAATAPFEPLTVARATDFVLGASLAVSRRFVETVGLMEESYFLYYEEMDWAVRGRRRGRFETAFAHGAVVYHKEGGSIGSSSTRGGRSAMSEYYLMRSRMRFYARNRRWLWPVIWLQGWIVALRRLARRQPAKAWAVVRAMMGLRPSR